MLFLSIPQAFQRLFQRIGGRHLDVRFDSGAFPVGLGDRVNDSTERYFNEEVIVEAVR